MLYSEPHTSGFGCHSGIFLYDDGHINIQIDPRCLEETADEVHIRYYEELDQLFDTITEDGQYEVGGRTGVVKKGDGRIGALMERWPAIFELAMSLP